METDFGPLVILGLSVLVGIAMLLVGGGTLWWLRSTHAPRPSVSAPSDTTGDRMPPRVSERLRADYQAGRHDRLLRYLERAMPEWPVSSSLIEVARELVALEQRAHAARTSGVPEPVTSRLAAEAERIAEPLWNLAERVAAAAAFGASSPALRDELAGEDATLVRLLAAMREARAGLGELTLSGAGGRDELRRAEGRFRALAETARELRDFDQGLDA